MLLVVHEHAVRHRIVVADDAVDEFVHEGIRLEAEGLDGEAGPSQPGTRHRAYPCAVASQSSRRAAMPGRLRHAADTRGQIP